MIRLRDAVGGDIGSQFTVGFKEVPLTREQEAARRHVHNYATGLAAGMSALKPGPRSLDLDPISADGECVHGRCAGDPCPQPEFVPNGTYGHAFERNPDRRWVEEYPCDCFDEPGARGRSQEPVAEPVQVPGSMGKKVRSGQESTHHGGRQRRARTGLDVPARD